MTYKKTSEQKYAWYYLMGMIDGGDYILGRNQPDTHYAHDEISTKEWTDESKHLHKICFG